MIDEHILFENFDKIPHILDKDDKIDYNLFDKYKYKINKTLEKDSSILEKKLQEIANRLPIKAKTLSLDDYPQIKTKGRQSCELEIAEIVDYEKKKILMYGNAHGLIFPFLQRAVETGVIHMPINTVVNVDQHADIAPYTDLFTYHTTSWQRYGVDNGFWQREKSYNWQPARSTATPRNDFLPEFYIKTIKTDQVDAISPEVLSIDLDFFNNIFPESSEFNIYIEKLIELIRRSKCVFVFSSSGWTEFETLSLETMQSIIQEIQNTFTEEKK